MSTLTTQLEASVKRERRASMALTRSDLARRAEAKQVDKFNSPIKSVPLQPQETSSTVADAAGVGTMVMNQSELDHMNSEKDELAQENSRYSVICHKVFSSRVQIEIHELFVI